jgi:MoxR-like ATPase
VPERAFGDVLVAIVAEDHVLIEDHPGVGKTALVRAMARSMDAAYSRVPVHVGSVTGRLVGNQRVQPA